MFAVILESVEIPRLPSVRRDEQWDRLKGCRVADAVIKARNTLRIRLYIIHIGFNIF